MKQTLSERVAQLEREVAELKNGNARNSADVEADTKVPWWEAIRGTFKDDPIYDEAMRLGREYRESLRPPDYKLEEEA